MCWHFAEVKEVEVIPSWYISISITATFVTLSQEK